MTKAELILYSANKVKRDKTLFAEFVRLYTEEFGKAPNCSSCIFNSTFNRWKTTPQKHTKMKAKKTNTFVLKNQEILIRIPFSTIVLSKDSSDADVLKYLNQEKKKYFKERSAYFLKLPDTKKEEVKK